MKTTVITPAETLEVVIASKKIIGFGVTPVLMVLGALVVVEKTFTYRSTKSFSTCFPESAHDAPLHPQY